MTLSGYDGEHCFASCPYGNNYQSEGAPPTFPVMFLSFWTESSMIIGREEGDVSPGPLVLQFSLIWIILL